MDITELLAFAVKNKASDLHLSAGLPPMIRVHGDIRRINLPPMEHEDVHAMVYDIMSDAQRKMYEEHLECDFSFAVPNLARFRVNAFVQQRGAAAAFRTIPAKVLSLEELNAPKVFAELTDRPRGLILCTGPTGSGKSTTLAAMVNHVNESAFGHIITIEDPIEFIHEFKKCLVTQREIGTHAPTFAEALKSAVREDPDLILVGEMRDLETISLALTAAETGIQVFATLHTNGAVRSVDRIVNVFPPRRQEQVRTMLSGSLRMVVSQQLVRRADGAGRLVAAEVMISTHAIASMIRSGNSHKLPNAIQAGGRTGMQSLDAVLTDMVKREQISGEEAYEHAIDRTLFERFLIQDNAA